VNWRRCHQGRKPSPIVNWRSGEKGSLNKNPEDYKSDEVIYVPSPRAVVPIDWIKNLKEWSIASSVLHIIGATLLGGTFLGETLPLVFGSVGGAMIAVGVIIDVVKFEGLIGSIRKKGFRVKIGYCQIITEETDGEGQLQEEKISAQI